jgi:hypothetical protein
MEAFHSNQKIISDSFKKQTWGQKTESCHSYRIFKAHRKILGRD